MVEASLRLWTGIAGIGAFAMTLPVIVLYFIASDPPPVWNVLVRVLLNTLLCAGFLVFVAGFSILLHQAPSVHAWLAAVVFAAGLVFVTVTLVANAIEAGAVLHAGTNIDPTRMGSGGESSQVIYGPIARVLTALFLLAAGAASLATGVTPAWTGWFAIAVAAFHLALAPTILSTTDPSRFYSLNGWSIPIAGGLLLTWVLTASITILRT
jgi:hypothetical protein